ncbi:MAG: metallopeptidase family protein [Pseudomonadota bacterium]
MDAPPAPDSPEAFLETCRTVMGSLPEPLRAAARRVAIVIRDCAEPEILSDLGLDNPLDLTGLYSGVSLIHESVMHPSPEGPMIFLYRHPILAEWRARGDVDLSDLIAHVFIHELAHHFGWSDEEIYALAE